MNASIQTNYAFFSAPCVSSSLTNCDQCSNNMDECSSILDDCDCHSECFYEGDCCSDVSVAQEKCYGKHMHYHFRLHNVC